MPIAHTNGIDIFYQITGWGPPVVMMCGVGQWHEFWYRNVPALSQHHAVITFDNRGIGESSQPDIPYDIPMLVADLLGLFDCLGLQQPHLIGHSLGALVALELAMSHPERVDRLILMSALYPGPQFVPFSAAAASLLFDRSGEPHELVKRGIRVATGPGFEERDVEGFEKLTWLRFHSRQTPALYLRQSVSGLGYLQADRLRAIDNPVLLMYGLLDQVVPPANGEMLAAKLPRSNLTLVDDAGHLFPIEKSTETNAAIIGYLCGKPVPIHI